MRKDKPDTYRELSPEAMQALLEQSSLTKEQWDGLPAWEKVSRVRAWRSPAA